MKMCECELLICGIFESFFRLEGNHKIGRHVAINEAIRQLKFLEKGGFGPVATFHFAEVRKDFEAMKEMDVTHYKKIVEGLRFSMPIYKNIVKRTC